MATVSNFYNYMISKAFSYWRLPHVMLFNKCMKLVILFSSVLYNK
jgi:hypothetical protein